MHENTMELAEFRDLDATVEQDATGTKSPNH